VKAPWQAKHTAFTLWRKAAAAVIVLIEAMTTPRPSGGARPRDAKGNTVAGWEMPELLDNFFKAFVPIFVSVDAIGVLPLFVGLTEGIDRPARKRIIGQSLITALLVAVAFIFFGKWIFGLMGITVGDFEVAGGVMLFVIAVLDLVSQSKGSRYAIQTIGAVPLGTPLIVGPATLTMSLILVDIYGTWMTVVAILLNIAIAGAVFLSADALTRILGRAGSQAVAKVASLILAAIAVMMIRKGMPEAVSAIVSAMHK